LYLQDLPSFTRKEVDLWNWYCQVGPGQKDWKNWAQEIFGHLLERPSGQALRLVQTHQVDTQSGDKVLSFGSKQEIFIGRDADNDVVLSANAIAKRNTRLILKDGQPYVEDLGGRLGTYLGDKKIQPNEPHLINDGDQFTVFPYRFRVVVEPETEVALTDCKVQALSRAEFFQLSPVGWRVFVIQAQPDGEQALLEASPSFLNRLQQGMLGPLGLDRTRGAVPSDDALLGFTILAVLEHLNRSLKFPFQLSLARGTRNSLADSTRGFLVSFTIGAGSITGNVRLFLSLDFLAKTKTDVATAAPAYPEGLSWNLPISVAQLDLSPDEISQVGLGDVLLAQRSAAILLPNFRAGWSITPEEGSNSTRFRVDKYFERSAFVEHGSEGASSARPNIEMLPLRLHVVLGEKEFSLAEIQSMGPGMIVEFEATRSEPVRLMVNGKVLGEGELVEVEGKLGVKVLRWRAS
jgi:flagellar motor switch protein FliN/FliY